MSRDPSKLHVFRLADDLATGSPSEVRYLLGLARRPEILADSDEQRLVQGHDELIRGSQKLTSALKDSR